MENAPQHQAGGCHHCGYCGCFHHKVVPLAVLLIALVFLLKAWGLVSAGFVDWSWPILLGLAMLVKLGVGKCSCYKSQK